MQVTKNSKSDYEALERRGYKFGKKIGKGSYGNVVVVRYQDKLKQRDLTLACKCVDKNKAPKDFLIKFFPREIEILRKISHPYIISIHSILQSGQTVFIFMKWAENGDLLDFILKQGSLAESHACLWFYQMCSAIKYLHSLNYAHRDLKCENILISAKLNIKIADFGFTRKCIDDTGDKVKSETFCGSTGKKTKTQFILS
jgi:testis-specific serine kinase